MYANLRIFIDGQWPGGDGGVGEDVINPGTEKPLARLLHAAAADLDRALEAAGKGFAVWRRISACDRACGIQTEGDDIAVKLPIPAVAGTATTNHNLRTRRGGKPS